MSLRGLVLAVARIVAVGAIATTPSSSRLKPLGLGGFVSIPMRLYKQDCTNTKRAVLAQVPGAGMTPASVTPFQEVLKDGFYEVACVKDFMYEHGDKFGDGKFAYELGDVSNVSIVLYETHVSAEDREPMTHDVCFKFCRTIPDMLFFGLTHGRDCYCAPYYTPEASDSSTCDAVCEGDNTMMCGGMSKSTVFQMHECSDTASDIADATAKMSTVTNGLAQVSSEAKTVAESMQSIADSLQPAFGKVGDSAATGLLQLAKVTAGKLLAAAAAGAELVDNMKGLDTSAQSAGAASGFEAVTAAESLVAQMGTITTKGEGAADELSEALALAKPPTSAANGSSALYYPVMYFVDKDHTEVPSTCGGNPAQEAIVSDFQGCAAACTAAVGPPSCVGFSYLSQGAEGLCFLFNALTSTTFYTGCSSSAFLQRSIKDAAGTKCMAKFKDFEGTSLAPDPSGKCAKCLKSATKADRCFE